jgi:hypothetical protein
MGGRVLRAGLLVQLLLALSALWAAGTAAEPGTGPRETVDQTFTTTRPASPTGIGFSGRYHADGDESGNPPYMRRMVFHPPPGMRYDTSVPERCTATDAELQLLGPAACPAGSRLGEGTTEGIFYEPVGNFFEFDRFTHPIHIVNNTNEQIVLVEAEGYAVVRGRFQADGSLVFESPTCFPTPPTGCVNDHVLQLATTSTIPPYTTASGSYATTPPKCPAGGYWRTTVQFTWADGNVDDVVTRQPCSPARNPSP